MKRFAIGLCGLLVLGLASAVHAEEPTPEKMAASQKAYKEFSEFLMADGGVWEATVQRRELVNGKMTLTDKMDEVMHEYRLIGEGRFTQRITKTNGKKDDLVEIFGVDSESGELAWWSFGKDGIVPAPMTKQKDGTWVLGNTFTNDQGEIIAWKITLTLGKDEARQEMSATVNGIEVPKEVIGPPTIWKRHSK